MIVPLHRRTLSILFSLLLMGMTGGPVPADTATLPMSPSRYHRTLAIPPLSMQALDLRSCFGRVDAAGALTITLRQHTGNTYAVIALVPRPKHAPIHGLEYTLSFDTRFKKLAPGNPGKLGLGLCDSRGWTRQIQSAISIPGAEKATTWTRLAGIYHPLPDGRGVQIVVRVESGRHTVSGIWQIRHMRLRALSRPGISPAQLALLKRVVVPQWERRHAPPPARGFNIQTIIRSWSKSGRGGFLPGVKFFQTVRRWGATVVRVPLDPAGIARDRGRNIWALWPRILDEVAATVKNARLAGVKVVLVLGNPPLANMAVSHDSSAFWHQPDLAAVFCRIWRDLARKLKSYDRTIYGYDLYNEPVDPAQSGPPRQWRPLAIKIIRTIRRIDRKVWIIYEPGPWNNPSGFAHLYPLPFRRVMYSIHFYSPRAFTHQGVYDTRNTDLAHAMKMINVNYPGVIGGVRWNERRLNQLLAPVDRFQARWGVPIFVGEFGAVRWAPRGSAARWLADVTALFNRRRWAWCFLAFRSWNGWSLEYGNSFWRQGMPYPKPVRYETARARVIRAALAKNLRR